MSSVPSLILLMVSPHGMVDRKGFSIGLFVVLGSAMLVAPWLDPNALPALLHSLLVIWSVGALVRKRLHDLGASGLWVIGLLVFIILGWSASILFEPFIAFCLWLPTLAMVITLVTLRGLSEWSEKALPSGQSIEVA